MVFENHWSIVMYVLRAVGEWGKGHLASMGGGGETTGKIKAEQRSDM